MARKFQIETRSEPVRFTLAGISCHVRDYHLTFLLNEKLELDFTKEEDLQGYPLYFCRDENCFNTYYLLGNRGENSLLIPEMKQTDYLLLVEGPFTKVREEKLLKKIRQISKVLMAYDINPEILKNIDTLLNDLEMHFLNIHKELKTKYSPTKH